jgi:hypothetical protein
MPYPVRVGRQPDHAGLIASDPTLFRVDLARAIPAANGGGWRPSVITSYYSAKTDGGDE